MAHQIGATRRKTRLTANRDHPIETEISHEPKRWPAGEGLSPARRRSGVARGPEERCLLFFEFVLGEHAGVAKLSEPFQLPDEHVHRP
jgi:hypothetical protein